MKKWSKRKSQRTREKNIYISDDRRNVLFGGFSICGEQKCYSPSCNLYNFFLSFFARSLLPSKFEVLASLVVFTIMRVLLYVHETKTEQIY